MPRSDAERAALRDQIATAYRQGASQAEIAAATGYSRSMVQKTLRSLGLAGRAAQPRVGRAAKRAPLARRPSAPAAIARRAAGPALTPFAVGLQTVLPPPDHFATWRRADLDRDTFDRAEPAELVSLLVNISPDISRAIWDYLRLLDPGHEITARRPGSEEPDERAKAALEAFLDELAGHYGSLKVITGRLFMQALVRGAFFAELVLDEAGRRPVDLVTPDPALARFRLVEDPVRGQRWQLGQWQHGQFVPLEVPTIRYIALDPEPGVPYGRPMLAPAIFPAVFLMGLLHDLRRVIAQQGYPRTDLIVKLEQLKVAWEELVATEESEESFGAYVDAVIAGIERAYGTLEPDDAFVHADTIEVGDARGAIDTSALAAVDALFKVVERMLMRALKSMPLLMGTTDGVSEANANRQWEIHAAGVKSLQHLAETLLGQLLTEAVVAMGFRAEVRVRFAELRAAEELRDAQSQQLRLSNAITAEAAGYMDHDEASVLAVGHAAVGPAISGATAAAPDASTVNPEPGSNRQRRDVPPVSDAVDSQLVARAIASWDRIFAATEYVGLLEAEIVQDAPPPEGEVGRGVSA